MPGERDDQIGVAVWQSYPRDTSSARLAEEIEAESAEQSHLLRAVVGNPFATRGPRP